MAVEIPPYDVPLGTTMSVQTQDGTITFEREADGWEVISFEAAPPKKEA